jgi:hypothetical protein
MAYKGGQYVITATATNITTALSLGSKMYCRQIDIKNADAATAALYLGGSTVTNVPASAYAQIPAGKAWSGVAVSTESLNTDEIYLVGTANAANIAFITLIP